MGAMARFTQGSGSRARPQRPGWGNGAFSASQRSRGGRPVKPDRQKPFSHVILRRRDKHGNPIPGKIVASRPLINLDGDMLRKAAEAAVRSPGDAKNMEPLVRASNAIQAEQVVHVQRKDIVDARDANNKRQASKLTKLAP